MAFISYTVQSGDNLTSIANEFDTNIQNIQNYNSIISPDNIDVIAYSGASGEGVTGPHLHFQRMVGEVSNQAAENPREFLEQLGLNSQ